MAVLTILPNISPDFGWQEKVSTATLEVSFGDGYEQRTPDGINPIRGTVPFKWSNLDKADMITLTDFFKARGGHEAFKLTLPDETVARRFKCKEWTRQNVDFDVYDLSAQFIEVFDLG